MPASLQRLECRFAERYRPLADQDTVLGTMAYPGMPRPYFFLLQRDHTR